MRPQWKQRTPEWLAVRRGLLTASDAAAALGVAPYPSFRGDPRAELMTKKLDATPIRGMFLVHGVRYEAEACDAAMRSLGETCHEFGLLVHPDHPWLAASPDGVTTNGFCVEIKCPMKRAITPGHVPEHYYPQVQVQMFVTGCRFTYFVQYKPAFLMPDNRPFVDIVVVERDDAWLDDALPKMRAFWEEYDARRKSHVPRCVVGDTCDIVEDLYGVQ